MHDARCIRDRIGELQALFVRHNAGAALCAKTVFKPTKEFKAAGHMLYSAEKRRRLTAENAGSVRD